MSRNINAILYYANWCGHCQRFKPEWERFTEKVNNEFAGNVTVKSIEDSEISGGLPVVDGHQIRGYPTVVFDVKSDNNSKQFEYNGKRNADALMEFTKSLSE